MAVESLPQFSAEEWARCLGLLVDNFAAPLGMSRWEYEDIIPLYVPQPVGYEGRFDTLVLVQPPQPEKGLTLEKILDIIGLSYRDPVDLKMVDREEQQGGFQTPNVPYACYLDLTSHPDITPRTALTTLSGDERFGTGLEGISLHMEHPKAVERNFLYFPGSLILNEGNFFHSLGSPAFDNGTPWLAMNEEIGPQLSSMLVGRFILRGSVIVTAGKKIVTRDF